MKKKVLVSAMLTLASCGGDQNASRALSSAAPSWSAAQATADAPFLASTGPKLNDAAGIVPDPTWDKARLSADPALQGSGN